MTTESVSVSVLRTIHRIHRQISDLKGRQERGPKQVRTAEAHVKHQEEQLVGLHEQLTAMRKAADARQLQLKTGESKIKELKAKLNAASSNREYQAFKEQMAALEMANSVLDDEILEAWEKIEQFQQSIAEAEEAVAKAKEKHQAAVAVVEQDRPGIQGDLARLQSELIESERNMPADLKEKYQRVVRQMGEEALAPIESQCCIGCNQQVPLNVVAAIKLGQPVFCPSCGRLLYIPEGA
jgi:predicted  nucleic acid-binding Zn-ribbon protein